MLADDILAARGSRFDEAGILTSLAGAIEQAQRFDLHDDVVTAALNLCQNRPSSLLEMQPFCRLPYPKVWLEWRRAQQLEFYSLTLDADGPKKAGCLLKLENDNPQIVVATQVWSREFNGERQLYACPYGLMFDWSEDGALLRVYAGTELEKELREVHRSYVDVERTIEELHADRDWARYSKSETEIQALMKLNTTVVGMPSLHAFDLLMGDTAPAAEKRRRAQGWREELQGLSYIVRAVVTLFNARNGLTREPVDRSKVNRQRIKRGKPPLLPYISTSMTLSAAQQRHADAQGIDRASARQHLVRGHLKTIKGNLYWWSPHLRGDPLRPVARREYAVKVSA